MGDEQVRFRCPQCKLKLKVHPDLMGMVTPCPGCRHELKVPGNPISVAETRGVAEDTTGGVREVLSLDDCPQVASAPWWRRYRHHGLILAAGVVVFLLSWAVCDLLTSRRDEGGGAGSSSPPPPSLVVTDNDLWDAYHDNAAAADAKYKGRRIEIRGNVGKVTPDGGEYSLGMAEIISGPVNRADWNRMGEAEKNWRTNGYPPGVIARFPAYRQDELRKLRGTVRVWGRCAGRRDDPKHVRGYYVLLEDCTVAADQADPPGTNKLR